jgi:toxin YoeB
VEQSRQRPRSSNRLNVLFSDNAWKEYVDWSRTDPDILEKINQLIEAARRTPHQGLGKPEALKGDLRGWWSRRITAEHRLVYRVKGKRGVDQHIEIAQCQYHY